MSDTLYPTAPVELVEAVPRLQEAFARLIRAVVAPPDAEQAMLDLPVLQIKCLRFIADHEGQKLRQLASGTALPVATVSRLIDGLVQAGLVTRHADPDDRRAVKLGTTARSREMLARRRAVREAHLAACARRLTLAEIETVMRGFDLISAAAEQVRAERGTIP